MVKAILRTKSIGTKVTEEEYARLDELAAAAGRSRAEWVRTKLLDGAKRGVLRTARTEPNVPHAGRSHRLTPGPLGSRRT
jgi:hypothetical protein